MITSPLRGSVIEENVVFSKIIEPVEPQYRECEFKSERINRFLKENNIRLYSHQVEAIEEVRNGRNVVITTPTASGKSMIYMLSILERIEQNRNTRAILVFPLNALARDQKYKIENLIRKTKINATVESYYGDTPKEERARIRQNPPNILITTPDMLNQGILPYHYLWRSVYKNLEFVVIDEIHVYGGVLGSHVANVLRRLNRLCLHYRKRLPTYICNSATIRNPVEFAEKLTGTGDFVEISKSGSPSPERVVSVVQNISDYHFIDFIILNLKNEVPTLVFIDSRREIEVLYLNILKRLKELGLDEYAGKVKTYRAGYQEFERREIENALAKGDALVVLSTGALEMGVDIGEVDCVVVKGFPGSLAALWQRFGRAGRRGKTAYNYFIAKRSVLDQYYLKNPEEIFSREVEEPVISPNNKEILRKHIIAMAKELPITADDIAVLDDNGYQVLTSLLRERVLVADLEKGVIELGKSLDLFFDIRSAGGGVYKVIDVKSDSVIGELSQEYVFYEGYEGATYIHLGKMYEIVGVDESKRVVYVGENKRSYYTRALISSEVSIVKEERSKKIRDIEVKFGEVEVTSQIDSYNKVDIETGQIIGTVYLEKPVVKTYSTKAFWIILPMSCERRMEEFTLRETVMQVRDILKDRYIDGVLVDTEESAEEILNRFSSDKVLFRNKMMHLSKSLSRKQAEVLESAVKRYAKKNVFVSGMYGLENAITSIYSIFAMNDRRDIDSSSNNFHYQTLSPTIFIFDAYEGGLGYAEVGYERIMEILEHAYRNIKNCSCGAGCPACVLSYKNSNNEKVDKLATQFMLEVILGYRA
ncbi:MAG: DEAD/DEAH box helicase [Sulfurihydrogenibium sp.]|jgi:DEAD/DEAH box helicase domain-containing protein|nr:DEAD/DEAH box helicase [Sulfurihydrogenibium sp.]